MLRMNLDSICIPVMKAWLLSCGVGPCHPRMWLSALTPHLIMEILMRAGATQIAENHNGAGDDEWEEMELAIQQRNQLFAAAGREVLSLQLWK